MDLPSIPDAYFEAKREISRLFHAGELTAENYGQLRDKALKSIDGIPYAGMLVEGLALYAPLGGAEHA
jgi:hypothetical protein